MKGGHDPPIKGATLYPYLAGMALARPMSVFENNIDNLVVAIKKRILYYKEPDGTWRLKSQLTHDPDNWARMDWIKSNLINLAEKCEPYSFEECIKYCPPDKKELYRKVKASLEMYPLRESDKIIRPFVKVEKSVKPFDSLWGNTKEPSPRVIQARNPRAHYMYMRFYGPVEKRLFGAIDKLCNGRVTIMKGLNTIEIASALREKWERFEHPCAIPCDADKFDQKFSVPAYKYFHSIIDGILQIHDKHDKALWERLKKWQLTTIGKASNQKRRGPATPAGGLKQLWYREEGILCSGDVNTSTAACAIVVSLFLCHLTEESIDYELADNGDDCVVIVESRHADLFVRQFPAFARQFGFLYVCEEPVTKFEQIKFCQMKPVFEGHTRSWVMVRDPDAALCKDTVIVKSGLSDAEIGGIYKSIAQGGLALYGNMPVYGAFYNRLFNMFAHHKVSKYYPGSYMMRQYARDVRFEYVEPHPHTRASFARCFGITPARQLEMEAAYARPIYGPKEICLHPIFDTLLQ